MEREELVEALKAHDFGVKHEVFIGTMDTPVTLHEGRVVTVGSRKLEAGKTVLQQLIDEIAADLTLLTDHQLLFRDKPEPVRYAILLYVVSGRMVRFGKSVSVSVEG